MPMRSHEAQGQQNSAAQCSGYRPSFVAEPFKKPLWRAKRHLEKKPSLAFASEPAHPTTLVGAVPSAPRRSPRTLVGPRPRMEAARVQLAMVKALRVEMAAASAEEKLKLLPDVVRVITGEASWYGPGFYGNHTANGEIYRQGTMTAAHRTLPFGTKVRVTNLWNGRSAVIRINDRGPFIDHRVIDLGHGAASTLGLISSGIAQVKLEVLR